ncbi:MAG: DUF1294 domain-containing protein [Lachnospiraceae bacterium]|nr:DUF1294 domain-containing protein [Lachnospiraceae bacterium]
MLRILLIIIAIYLLIINIVGFIVMGVDKGKAKRGAWRIPEATLFLFAFVGGGIGTTLGMNVFRHKTKHWYFKFGMPLIAIVEYGLLFYLLLTFVW